MFEDLKRDPWSHRSENMRCRTCMWFVQKIRNGDSEGVIVGRCRRHAPTMEGYPVVFENDWCGDHKLDENRIGIDIKVEIPPIERDKFLKTISEVGGEEG